MKWDREPKNETQELMAAAEHTLALAGDQLGIPSAQIEAAKAYAYGTIVARESVKRKN